MSTPTDVRTTEKFWVEKRDGRHQLHMAHRGHGSNFCIAQINHWADNAEALANNIATACNAYEPMREALALVAGGFEGEGLEIENEWRRSIARNALNGVPLSEYEAAEARAALSILPVNDRQPAKADAELATATDEVFRSLLPKGASLIPTLVNDRHHSGSDNERLRKALSKIEVWADDRSHLNNVFETIAIEARAALNSTGRQTSNDAGILRKATAAIEDDDLRNDLADICTQALADAPEVLADPRGLDVLLDAIVCLFRDNARAALKGVPQPATTPFSGDLFEAYRLADQLLTMAARRSIETQFGWAHPDCANLQEAARILRNEPQRPQPEYVGAVLSDAPAIEAGKLSEAQP